MTSLTELNQKLFQLYSKKFGPDTVVMIHDSGKVRERERERERERYHPLLDIEGV